MTGGLAFWSIRAIGAADLTGIAHIEVDVWVILRRLIPNALELAAANAHDRDPDFIYETSDNFPSAARGLGARAMMDRRARARSAPGERRPFRVVWLP